jgi:hypothetical protein
VPSAQATRQVRSYLAFAIDNRLVQREAVLPIKEGAMPRDVNYSAPSVFDSRLLSQLNANTMLLLRLRNLPILMSRG